MQPVCQELKPCITSHNLSLFVTICKGKDSETANYPNQSVKKGANDKLHYRINHFFTSLISSVVLTAHLSRRKIFTLSYILRKRNSIEFLTYFYRRKSLEMKEGLFDRRSHFYFTIPSSLSARSREPCYDVADPISPGENSCAFQDIIFSRPYTCFGCDAVSLCCVLCDETAFLQLQIGQACDRRG